MLEVNHDGLWSQIGIKVFQLGEGPYVHVAVCAAFGHKNENRWDDVVVFHRMDCVNLSE